jgi:hypothetical protein
MNPKTMKDRSIKQVIARRGRRRINENGKGR